MQPPKRKVYTAVIVHETGSEPEERGRGYIVQSLKNACRNMRDGAAAIVIKDENGRIIGVDVSGTPSETFQEDIEETFGIELYEEEEPPRAIG